MIDADGKQVGVVSVKMALKKAEEAGLDLVEISPKATPPVCRILDFSKYYYEKERKARDARKKQHVVQVKEVKFGPNTEEHDYNFKTKNAMRFLKQHNKVKFTVRFRGRQMAHKDRGFELLERITEDLKDFIDVDSKPRSDRNLLSMVVSPKKEIDKILEQKGVVIEDIDTDETQEETNE